LKGSAIAYLKVLFNPRLEVVRKQGKRLATRLGSLREWSRIASEYMCGAYEYMDVGILPS